MMTIKSLFTLYSHLTFTGSSLHLRTLDRRKLQLLESTLPPGIEPNGSGARERCHTARAPPVWRCARATAREMHVNMIKLKNLATKRVVSIILSSLFNSPEKLGASGFFLSFAGHIVHLTEQPLGPGTCTATAA